MLVDQKRDEENDITQMNLEEEDEEDSEQIETTLLRKNRYSLHENSHGILSALTPRPIARNLEGEEEGESAGNSDKIQEAHRDQLQMEIKMLVDQKRDEENSITQMNLEEEDSEQIETTLLRKNRYSLQENSEEILSALAPPPVARNLEEEEEGGSAGNSDKIQEVQTSSSFTKHDLEIVLAEQDEYDLFCPNCNSCITKRVILRKQKRTGDGNVSPMKKIQPELVVADETERCQDGDDHNDDEDDESDREDEKEVFRCLSCFSFFTPTFGGGFKLFNLFGEKAKIQTEPQTIKPVVPVPDHDNSSEQTVINITPEAALRTSEENDILKPIVYGGLTEAIVSSGIVLSAAGAGISTVNIVALALASLIGGLVLKFFDILELHDVYYHQQSNDTRYYRVLGSLNNFKMNTAIALLSFIFVGIIPIAIYWLAQPSWMFNIETIDEYQNLTKLVATTVVSVILIGSLSLMKAHVQRPPKTYLKTCTTHLGIVLSILIISFGSGFMIHKWLSNEIGLLHILLDSI
ncbi:hypothetical protein ZOSMA_248G00270 [Zostera marina]|uniref:Membrane protein of ER body-like protein n=1 Tax=Zostera marina TaxID=29655 RepID=A0A0K9PGK9_ZOSMR|nr:hypothetical protein ZOSMA_248G00270 [Zostera marina]